MREVYFIAKVGENMSLFLLKGEYESYIDAQNAIRDLPKGFYQIQKFFEKKEEDGYEHTSKNSSTVLSTQTFA